MLAINASILNLVVVRPVSTVAITCRVHRLAYDESQCLQLSFRLTTPAANSYCILAIISLGYRTALFAWSYV